MSLGATRGARGTRQPAPPLDAAGEQNKDRARRLALLDAPLTLCDAAHDKEARDMLLREAWQRGEEGHAAQRALDVQALDTAEQLGDCGHALDAVTRAKGGPAQVRDRGRADDEQLDRLKGDE
jgi:hypothetical protein